MAVVGTLLALLVFFSLFGIFITQYLPLWMEENEDQLTNGLITSLSTLKAGMDEQYLFGSIPTYSVPFQMSSQSVPLLSQPTIGSLGFGTGCPGQIYSNGTPKVLAACSFETLSFNTGVGAAGSERFPLTLTTATNYLQVNVPNRYYPPTNFYLEDDALVAGQSSGHQWMAVAPPLNITHTAGNVTVHLSYVVLSGNASTYSGPGSRDVTSHFVARQTLTSARMFLNRHGAPRPFNLTLTMGTYDICGWFSYLHNLTSAALGSTGWSLTWTGGQAPSSAYPSKIVCLASATQTYDLTLKIFMAGTFLGVNYATLFESEDSLTFNAGGL